MWHIPGIGRWRVAGLHWGIGTIAYSALLKLHDNEFKGIRFQRCFSKTEAIEVFNAEAEKYDLIAAYSRKVFGWSFCHALERRE